MNNVLSRVWQHVTRALLCQFAFDANNDLNGCEEGGNQRIEVIFMLCKFQVLTFPLIGMSASGQEIDKKAKEGMFRKSSEYFSIF